MNGANAPNTAIGVFDSGIGGLSVLKALRAEMPLENFVYIADSGHAPYGERDEAHVIARSKAISAHLVRHNIKALVIACNTATAAAVHLLRVDYPDLPIIGVEPALKPAVSLSKTGRIGVMATRSTLASAKFQALLASQSGKAYFVLQACDGLADAIERSANSTDATEVIANCARQISAIGRFGHKNGEIDTLVLGCTHYPFASAHLAALLPDGVQLVASGEAVARQTRRLVETVMTGLEPAAKTESRTGELNLFTTGQKLALENAVNCWLGLVCEASFLQL